MSDYSTYAIIDAKLVNKDAIFKNVIKVMWRTLLHSLNSDEREYDDIAVNILRDRSSTDTMNRKRWRRRAAKRRLLARLRAPL